MAMLDDKALFTAITNTALEGCDCDTNARRETIWQACETLMADVLRQSDPFTAECLLRSLVSDLRDSAAHLDHLLSAPADNPSPYPRTPEQVH
jgi:hypothetical protein